jgi:hypothetical protein
MLGEHAAAGLGIFELEHQAVMTCTDALSPAGEAGKTAASGGQALNPPSTFHAMPVMNPASGLAR